MLTSYLVVNFLNDIIHCIHNILHLTLKLAQSISKVFQFPLKLKLKVILVTEYREEPKKKTKEAKEASKGVKKSHTLLVCPITCVEIELEKLESPPFYWMFQPPLFCEKTCEFYKEIEEHENKIGVGEECLTTDIPSEIQKQSDARAEGEGNIDLGEERGVSWGKVERLDTDEDDQIEGNDAGTAGTDDACPELK